MSISRQKLENVACGSGFGYLVARYVRQKVKRRDSANFHYKSFMFMTTNPNEIVLRQLWEWNGLFGPFVT